MTWLALRIFAYLLAALLMGGVAGWMLAKLNRRDRWHLQLIQAKTETGELQRQLDACAAEIRQLQAERVSQPGAGLPETSLVGPVVEERALSTQPPRVESTGQDLRDLEPQVEAMRMQNLASDNLIRALHRENTRLRVAAEESSATPRSVAALELTVKDLEGRLVRKMAEIDRLQQALAGEERKIRDLERERDLQNKSLHVLHQQLEMERKPQRFAG